MRKRNLILCFTALLLLSSVGQTCCYLKTKSDEKTNPFSMGENTITVVESFNGSVKTNVKIANTGTVPAYIRVKAVAGWYHADGSMAAVPVGGTYQTSPGTGWVQSGNYYYHRAPVSPGESTSVLFGSVSPNSGLGKEYDGLNFHFDVLADSVQANGTDDTTHNPIVVEAWGVNPSQL